MLSAVMRSFGGRPSSLTFSSRALMTWCNSTGVDGNVAARPVRGPAAAPARARRAIEFDGDGPVLVQQGGPGPDKGIVSAIDGHVSSLGRRYPGDPLLDLLRGAVEPAGHRARPELVTEGPVHRVRVPGQGRADKDQEDHQDHDAE